MIHELGPGSFARVEHIFRDRKQYVPALAVLQHRFPGKVYVDDPEAPTTAIVWVVSRWAYIAGDPQNDSFLSVIPISLQMNMPWFELYAQPGPAWEAAAQKFLPTFWSDKHYESTYTLDPDSYRQLPDAPPIPRDLTLQQTDFPIIPQAARRLDFIPDNLAQRTTFGFQLVRQEDPVAICKSNGLESGVEFMIDVRTISKSDRGKGLATIVTRGLIDHALKTGLTPLWETTEDNLPSQRLARRFGFVKRETYPVYAIGFPDEAGPQSSID
jgi:RimJ/RimL family protein N-acetyltransferase